MASENLLKIAMKLAKSLGANESKYMGRRSNINFLGKGPDEGKLFQQDINTEALAALPLNKVLPEIETSMSYASGGKLNDIQVNKLIDNMSKMADFYRPLTLDSVANVTDMASRTGNLTKGGLESLRGLGLKNLDNVSESPLMSKISERVGNIKNETEQASAIMETVPRNELPGKTAAAREFLLNALKEGDDVGRTTFADTINPRDLKFITEGGGGVDGDPIVLVQKYFGPRVAELLPSNATVEDMAIFTKRIIEGSTDAKGLRPTDPGFDNLTLKISEKIDDIPFADGGRARVGFAGGGKDAGAGSNFGNENFGNYGDGKPNMADIAGPVTTSPPGGNEGNGSGITSVVTTKNPGFFDYLTSPITSLQKYAGVYKDPEEEEETQVSKMNAAANSITNFQDFNTQNQKRADIAAEFAKQELNFADGGRASYRVGGIAKAILKKINKKKVKDAVDDIFETGDYKYDAEIAAEALVENNPKLFGGKLIDDIDEGLRSEIYGLTLAELSTRMALKLKATRAARSQGQPFQTFETTTPPRQFSLNVEKAISELNIPREEAMRIAQLPSSEQKAALDIYLNKDFGQRIALSEYNPKKFDAAKGGLAKILGV